MKKSKVYQLVEAAEELTHAEFMKWLKSPQGTSINQTDSKSGRTALHVIARLHDFKALQTLVKAGANVNLKDKRGCTPLFDACSHFLKRSADAKIVRKLLKSGAKVNVRDKDGWTPLGLAVVHYRDDIVKILLRAGARISADAIRHAWTSYTMLELLPQSWSKDGKAIQTIYDLLGRRTPKKSFGSKVSQRSRSRRV